MSALDDVNDGQTDLGEATPLGWGDLIKGGCLYIHQQVNKGILAADNDNDGQAELGEGIPLA